MSREEDTYAILEFQGYVCEVPSFDRDKTTLEFIAAPASTKTPMRFITKGEKAKAFKTMLHKGCLIQLQAIPSNRIEEWNGEKVVVLEWEAKQISLLGRRKVNLGKFNDIRVLDGLMPLDSEVEDVGYIDPESWLRFEKKRQDASDTAKRRKEDD